MSYILTASLWSLLTLSLLSPQIANAQADGYYIDIRFDASVPAVITAIEYDDIDVTITGYTPWLNRVSVGSPDANGVRLVTATFNNPGMTENFATPPPPGPSRFRLNGLPAGSYTLYVRYPNSTRGEKRQLVVRPAATKITLNTYCENGTFSCVINGGDPGSSRGLGGGPFDVQSDSEFKAWAPAGSAPIKAVDVRRLRYAKTRSGGSYFFTANPSEVATLTKSGFVDEGVVFRALPVELGVCSAATKPVYRVFIQNPVGGGSHRYTTDINAYREWTQNQLCNIYLPNQCFAEGIAFCVPAE